MALLPPGTAGGGDGVSNHNDLAGRDAPNAHPISAVTGLQDWLERLDRSATTSTSIRQIYSFTGATTQDILLPQPLDTPSATVTLVRTSDGAVIEPEIAYFYGPGPLRFIERVRLGFTPPLSGEYMVHVVR